MANCLTKSRAKSSLVFQHGLTHSSPFHSFLEHDCRNEAPLSLSLIPIMIYRQMKRSVWKMSLNRDATAHSAPCCFAAVGERKPGASNSDADAAAPEGKRSFPLTNTSWGLLLSCESCSHGTDKTGIKDLQTEQGQFIGETDFKILIFSLEECSVGRCSAVSSIPLL